jgi:hypothetical protein
VDEEQRRGEIGRGLLRRGAPKIETVSNPDVGQSPRHKRLGEQTREPRVQRHALRHAVERDGLETAKGAFRPDGVKCRRVGGDERGPAEADIKIAVAELEEELESPELVAQISLNVSVVPPAEALIASRQKVISSVVDTRTPPRLSESSSPPLTIRLFLGADLSERDAYVYQEAT